VGGGMRLLCLKGGNRGRRRFDLNFEIVVVYMMDCMKEAWES
jgi:hypothetical protein